MKAILRQPKILSGTYIFCPRLGTKKNHMITCTLFLPIFTAAKDGKYFNYAGTAEWAQLDLQSIQHRDYFGHLSIYQKKIKGKVLFICRCSKNWQKKSAGNHLLSKWLPALFFCQFLLQRKMKSTLGRCERNV